MPLYSYYVSYNLFDIPKIIAAIRPKNSASIAVAERIGMNFTSEYDKEYDGKLMKHFICEINMNKIIFINELVAKTLFESELLRNDYIPRPLQTDIEKLISIYFEKILRLAQSVI